MMDGSIRRLFERYEDFFNRSLQGELSLDEVAELYASEFVAASPKGVMTGKNDESFKQMMAEGYARYRSRGTKRMRLRDVHTSPIDDNHRLAHVAWTATYARKDGRNTSIDFEVHYFVQVLNREPKVFGWVSGDEEEILKKHGII